MSVVIHMPYIEGSFSLSSVHNDYFTYLRARSISLRLYLILGECSMAHQHKRKASNNLNSNKKLLNRKRASEAEFISFI